MYKTNVPRFRNTSRAFTSLDLLACIAGVALMVAVITPVLAGSRSRSDRVACLSNLRQIGTAFRQFALEHDGNPPWIAGPDSNDHDPRKHELWFQYWWLRDSLGTPKILMDPAETRSGARVATEWGLVPDTGLQSLKDRAVAYGLGRGHYEGSDFRYTDLPQMIVTLDRNFIHSGFDGNALETTVQVRPQSTGWYDDVHGAIGNVAFADGSVDSLSSDQLREAVRKITETDARTYIRVWSAHW
jgi:prepilin-type processing-associated H-X9-DG protein